MTTVRLGIPGGGAKVIYSAVAETVFCGVSQHPKTGAYFSTIDIMYHQRDLGSVLKIAREMQQRSLFPQVIIEKKGGKADIMVLFRLKPASPNLLRKLGLMTNVLEKIRDEEIELFMTGETEVEEKDIQPFLKYFKRNGNFNVTIALPIEGGAEPLWGVQLSSILDKIPNLL